MYQSKKELQRKFETLQRRCKTLAIECKYWQNRYDELTTQCEKSNFLLHLPKDGFWNTWGYSVGCL